MTDYRTEGFVSAAAQPTFTSKSSTVVQTPLVLPLLPRAWSYHDPDPSCYLLTCLRGLIQNMHSHPRVRRSALRGRGRARITPDHRLGRAQSALQSWFKHSLPASLPKHQSTLVMGLVGAIGRLGFFLVLSGRALAARRCLSLGAARSEKGRSRSRHGGGRRGGRQGSGPPVEVRAGRAGCGRRGIVTEGGRADATVGHGGHQHRSAWRGGCSGAPHRRAQCRHWLSRAGPAPQLQLQPGTRPAPRTGHPRCGRGVNIWKLMQSFTGG